MTATNTITNTRSLVDFGSVSQLCNPFPGVLPTIGEEYIRSSDFVSAIVVLSSVDGGELSHIEFWEYHLAVCQPVVIVNILRTNAMEL